MTGANAAPVFVTVKTGACHGALLVPAAAPPVPAEPLLADPIDPEVEPCTEPVAPVDPLPLRLRDLPVVEPVDGDIEVLFDGDIVDVLEDGILDDVPVDGGIEPDMPGCIPDPLCPVPI